MDNRRIRNLGIAVVLAALLGAIGVVGWRAARPMPAASAIRSGGELVVSGRSEPRTFNHYVARGITTEIISTLTQANLVRINRLTQDVEPWLAESWSRSDDGLRYTLKLRQNVAFSDGHPFTADDVVFSFEAAYDEQTGGSIGDAMTIGGKKLQVAAPDPATVLITFPSAFAPGVRLLDNLSILPRHKLGAALKAGAFAKAWGLTTPVSELVGLGPFVISEYQPGQRLVFARNPRYWRRDAAGAQLPHLDRVTLEIVSDQNAELLMLESGQLDMTTSEIRPEDYLPLKRAADAGRINLVDLGVGMDADGLWFNLKPGALGTDPRAAWLQRDELRRAIAMAVDRKVFADTVFLGAGVPIYGIETPANKRWFASDVPQTEYDPAGARKLLASIGVTADHPARFTLITIKGNTAAERGTAVIRDELKKVGVVVDVVMLEQGAVVQRFLSGQYDAVYYRFLKSDADPAINPDFWFSWGSAHVWNVGQKTPATEWERRVDELMARQIASSDEGDRKRLYDEVQRVFSERLPIVFFVAPRVLVATSSRVTNLRPAVSRPQLLWSADTIAVREGAPATH